MNSNDLTSNIKYYGKFLLIIIIVFLILKLIVNLKIYEALLLSLIITISMLIIENIIYINDIAIDPLNCEQCKVNIGEINKNDNNTILSNVENEQQINNNAKTLEPFISDNIEKIINNTSELLNNDLNVKTEHHQFDELKKMLDELKKDNEILKSHMTNQNMTNQNITEGFTNTDELENFISEQQNQNKNLINKLKSEPNVHANLNKIKNTIIQQNNTNESAALPYLTRTELLNKPEAITQLNLKSELNPNTESTYDAGYVQYQQDGLQKQENDISFNNALFKMGIGEQNIVKPFMRDGSDYYKKIQSYSSKSPTPTEALESELKYGDYNYIGPLNCGMTNSEYTFVSPNNWFPVPPHPPVCVTNKQCTTCPIQITDGKDYMSWATLEDFNMARRFTGNMGINIDYVKNVLNNDNGY